MIFIVLFFWSRLFIERFHDAIVLPKRVSLKLNTQTNTKSLYLQITILKTLRQSLFVKIILISCTNLRSGKHVLKLLTSLQQTYPFMNIYSCLLISDLFSGKGCSQCSRYILQRLLYRRKGKISQLMRLWHFSSSVNSFFKRACAAIQWG